MRGWATIVQPGVAEHMQPKGDRMDLDLSIASMAQPVGVFGIGHQEVEGLVGVRVEIGLGTDCRFGLSVVQGL